MIGGTFSSSPLSIIGIIALLSYDFIYRPRGKARVIWFALLILVSLPLLYVFATYVAGFALSYLRYLR
jgi:hypothetical protein